MWVVYSEVPATAMTVFRGRRWVWNVSSAPRRTCLRGVIGKWALTVRHAYKLLGVAGSRGLRYALRIWSGLCVSQGTGFEWRDLDVQGDRPCVRARTEVNGSRANREDGPRYTRISLPCCGMRSRRLAGRPTASSR